MLGDDGVSSSFSRFFTGRPPLLLGVAGTGIAVAVRVAGAGGALLDSIGVAAGVLGAGGALIGVVGIAVAVGVSGAGGARLVVLGIAVVVRVSWPRMPCTTMYISVCMYICAQKARPFSTPECIMVCRAQVIKLT